MAYYIFLDEKFPLVIKSGGQNLKIIHFETIFQLIPQLWPCPSPTFWRQLDFLNFPPISYLLYTKQNTDRTLKFDWLRAGPYACVQTGIWTGWTSVHNNKGKHWLFVVLLVWVYNKALINLEFHFVRSVRHDVTTNIFAYGPHSRLIRAYYWTWIRKYLARFGSF